MFAANDALESSWAIKKGADIANAGVNTMFSVQQAGECAFDYWRKLNPSFNGNICGGGWSTLVFDAATQQADYSALKESAFPYMGRHLGYCPAYTFKAWKTGVPKWKYTGGYNGPIVAGEYNTNNAQLLKKMVRMRPQPVYVLADANFMYYQSGVFQTGNIANNGVNHAVLAVGFRDCACSGTSTRDCACSGSTRDCACSGGGGCRYWVIKNSWSKDWGEAGYMRMALTNDAYGTANMYNTIMNTPVHAS
jgi:hypothetical protein